MQLLRVFRAYQPPEGSALLSRVLHVLLLGASNVLQLFVTIVAEGTILIWAIRVWCWMCWCVTELFVVSVILV